MANKTNKTKVITGMNTRLSYFHGWEPASINGGPEKYSVSVLIRETEGDVSEALSLRLQLAKSSVKKY